jgi:glycerophosphoryl diester phosphodiesterase
MVWCPDAHLAGALLEAGADAVVVDEVPTVLELLGPQDARTRVPRTVDVGRSSRDA